MKPSDDINVYVSNCLSIYYLSRTVLLEIMGTKQIEWRIRESERKKGFQRICGVFDSIDCTN